MTKLTVVIMAGGESKRMGQDKALVPFLGQSLIQRVLARVAALGDEVLITGNQPEELAFLGVPVYPDLLRGRGALSGLYTAFASAQHPLVAVVGCDMPFVSPGLLTALRDALLMQDVDAVVPRTREGLEPFHAVYRREPCLAAVKAALEAGFGRADSWHAQVRMAYFNETEVTRYDPRGEAFININTVEELKTAERYAQGKTKK